MKHLMIQKIFALLLITAFLILSNTATIAQISPNETNWGVHPIDYSRVGTAGWQFLKLPTNPRSAAMGGVISATSHGDVNSVFTNPSSLLDVNSYEFSASHMNWVADISFQSIAVAKNFGDYGTVGLGLVYLDYGSMVRTKNILQYDALGNSLGVLPISEGLGTFSAADFALGLSYSKRITDKLQIGGTVKYIQERLDDATASNWAIDISTLYYTGFNSLRISFVGQNFGPDATFSSYDERIQVEPVRVKMPMVLTMGLGYDFLEGKDGDPHKLTSVVEYRRPNDGNDKINFGMEYSYLNSFYLRGGYRFNYDEEGLTFGAGINYDYTNDLAFKVDYAYISVGIFNQVHMFSIGIKF